MKEKKVFILHQFLGNHKKLVSLFLMLAVFSIAVFAQESLSAGSVASGSGDDFGLGTKISELLTMLSSPWIKGLACIALIIEAIGLLTAGRQEPGMFKKFVPWIAGTIIFMAAGTITNKFMNVSKDTFTNVTN